MEEVCNDLSAMELVSTNYIKEILSIENAEIREHVLMTAEARAKELKVIQNFKRLVKVVQAEIIQSHKQINSLETNFTESPIKLKCKNYICNDLGITKSEFNPTIMKTVDTIICPHPLLPIERLINIDTNIEKVKLAFYKDKKWQTVIAEKNTLASKNKILQLANTGIEVNENNAKELIIFISELLAINTEIIPYSKSITHLGWTEDGFVPFIKDYKFDGDRSFEPIFKDIKEKGNYEIWVNTLRELRKNKVVHFIIASSFASVLIEKLHINPFIVHLWGKSGTGKSVSLIIAMSIWGNPAIGHLVKNLNSTHVGLERLSAFLNNIPFAGDELQAIKSRSSNFNELIYKLTQGEGKSRGTADGGIQEQLKWNCAFLTTGEEPITSEFSKEGVKNRVIEIEENNTLIENGKEIVNTLMDNYGYGAKVFLNNIPTDEILRQRHTKIFEELDQKYKSTGKQTNAIATVILADEIISKYIFEDEALKIDEVGRFFTKNIDETERIYNLIVDCFSQNISKFKSEGSIERWGTYDEINNQVTNFYFIPSVLRKFLSDNNISFDGIKSKLLDKGYIEVEKGRYTVQKWIDNKNVKCIKFHLKDEEKDNTDLEMPF